MKSIKFDLLELHVSSEDKDMNGSWIKASGTYLNNKLLNLLGEVYNEGLYQNDVAKFFVDRIGCSLSTGKRQLIKLKRNEKWVALEVINLIVELWAQTKGKKNGMGNIKQKIVDEIEFLKIGQGQSTPIKAQKILTETICKIAGAHAADGHLNRKNGLILEDADRNGVKSFSYWVYETFGLNYNVRPAEGRAWRIEIYNKIISRYLQIFLGFPVGKKTHTVSEPQVIRDAPFNYRKAFALGAMTFDGCVDIRGNVRFEVYSKNLANSISDILIKDDFNVIIKRYKNSGFVIRLPSPSNRILQYFESGTKKSNILKFYRIDYKSEIDSTELRNTEYIANKLGIFDLTTLSYHTGKKKNTLVDHVFILRKKGKIKRINDPVKIAYSHIINKDRIYFYLKRDEKEIIYNRIKEKFHNASFFKLSDILHVNRATLYLWLRGNSGIPFTQLQRLCNMADIEMRKMIKNSKISSGQDFYEAIKP